MKSYGYILAACLFCVFSFCSVSMAADEQDPMKNLGENFYSMSAYDLNNGGSGRVENQYFKGSSSDSALTTDYDVLLVKSNYYSLNNQKHKEGKDCVIGALFIVDKNQVLVDGSNKYVMYTRLFQQFDDSEKMTSEKYIDSKVDLFEWPGKEAVLKDDGYIDYLQQFLPDGENFDTFLDKLDKFMVDNNKLYGFSGFYQHTFWGDSGDYSCISDTCTLYPNSDYAKKMKNDGQEVIIYPSDNPFDSLDIKGKLKFLYPFLYRNDLVDSGNDSASEKFICYLTIDDYMHNFSLTNKLRFYWDVSKYPNLADCYIELRAEDLDHSNLGFYWFSSIDSKNKKNGQEFFSLFSFSAGECIVYDYVCDDYFHNLLEKFSEIFAPYNSSKYRFQLRVISLDKSKYTDWITFDLNDINRQYSTSIYDDDGNLVDKDITDNDDYDKDFVERNPGGTGDWKNSDNPDSSIWGPGITEPFDFLTYFSNFLKWLSGSIQIFSSFSGLLSTVYSWLPEGVIMGIGISIFFIVVVRVLGR